MVILIKTIQFFLSLSILVILHELGHFMAAKLFKTRVEKFYMFFNPWFSIFKKKIGETEYGVGWVPLGGYVKISGMIDESMDKEAMKLPPQPWEFRSKPAWQRLIIMIGGVTVNAILAILIFAMVLFVWGKPFLPPENLSYGVYADSIGYSIGIQDGDKILEVDEKPFSDFNRLNYEIIIHEAKSLTVDRGGKKIKINIPPGTIKRIISERNGSIAFPRFPVQVKEVRAGSQAMEAGLMAEDKILSVDRIPTAYYHDFTKQMHAHKTEIIDLGIVRGKDTLILHPKVSNEGTIGFLTYTPSHFLDQDTLHYSFFASIPAGLHEAKSNLQDYITQIKMILPHQK